MDGTDSFRRQARATWAAGDWDSCSGLISPVGAVVLDRLGLVSGRRLLDVGTGSGSNLAMPAARRGAEVVGLDVTPELLDRARRRAEQAGLEIEWVEGDAQQLPFADSSFDCVTSTFGAMFAPDHQRAAAELVRVCRAGGQIIMTTWADDGFVGELFTLTDSFVPPPPGVQAPPLWGVEGHIADVFQAVDVSPSIERASVDFDFASVDDAVERYGRHFGPFVSARATLEPHGRWEAFIGAFRELVERFNLAADGTARVRSDYFLIHIHR